MPEPSTIWPVSPIFASAKSYGSMSMEPLALWRSWLLILRQRSTEWNARIRWPSTFTNGDRRPTTPASSWCAMPRRTNSAFASPAAYLQRAERGMAAGSPWPCDFGPDLSRGFRALKVWFTLKVYGIEALGASISRSCALARYLEDRIAATPELELMAPVELNIVCFRYRVSTDSELGRIANQLNARLSSRCRSRELWRRLRRGIRGPRRFAQPSSTTAPAARRLTHWWKARWLTAERSRCRNCDSLWFREDLREC